MMRPIIILASAFLTAAGLASTVFAPVTVHAQSQQATGVEREIRQGLRVRQARHWTNKRHQIIRAERGTPNSTIGAGR